MPETFADRVAELAESWINGNRKTVCKELVDEAARDPADGIALALGLADHLIMLDQCNEVASIANLLNALDN